MIKFDITFWLELYNIKKLIYQRSVTFRSQNYDNVSQFLKKEINSGQHYQKRKDLYAENPTITSKVTIKKNLITNNFYNKINKNNTLHYRLYQELLDNIFFFNIFMIK